MHIMNASYDLTCSMVVIPYQKRLLCTIIDYTYKLLLIIKTAKEIGLLDLIKILIDNLIDLISVYIWIKKLIYKFINAYSTNFENQTQYICRASYNLKEQIMEAIKVSHYFFLYYCEIVYYIHELL